jgi:hypothetical protein
MTDKNVRDFERLIATTVIPEIGRYLKSIIRLRRDGLAVRKACMTAVAAAPDSHKIVAANLVEFAEALRTLDCEISAMEPGLKGIPAFLAATCAELK